MESQVVSQFTDLLNAVVNAMPSAQRPARVIPVVPGTMVVWDECEQGQLTGRLAALEPVSLTDQRCQIDYWIATGELTLLGCALGTNDQGEVPKAGDLAAEGAAALSDTDLLLKTVASFEWVDAIISWSPLGPDGGCKGIVITFTFKLDQPFDPPIIRATGVVAGTPGYFTPQGATPPANLTDLQTRFSVTGDATPPDSLTPWVAGQYVVLGDNSWATWVLDPTTNVCHWVNAAPRF